MPSSQPPADEVRSVGYTPLRIFAAHLQMKVRSPENASDKETPAAFQWNWRFATDDTIDVVFGVKLDGTKARGEDVEVLISGTFQLPDAPTIKLDQFVRTNAVATLYPFAREAVSSLTSHGFFGAYLVPLINTVSFSRRLEMRETDGFDRLLHDRVLRERVATMLSPEMLAMLEDNDRVSTETSLTATRKPASRKRSSSSARKSDKSTAK